MAAHRSYIVDVPLSFIIKESPESFLTLYLVRRFATGSLVD